MNKVLIKLVSSVFILLGIQRIPFETGINAYLYQVAFLMALYFLVNSYIKDNHDESIIK